MANRRGRPPPGRGRGRRRRRTRPAQPPEHRHRHPLPRLGRRRRRSARVRAGLARERRPGGRGGPSAPGRRGAGGAAGTGRPRRPQRPGLRRRLQPRRYPHPDPGGGAGGVHLGLRAGTPGRAIAPASGQGLARRLEPRRHPRCDRVGRPHRPDLGPPRRSPDPDPPPPRRRPMARVRAGLRPAGDRVRRRQGADLGHRVRRRGRPSAGVAGGGPVRRLQRRRDEAAHR